MSLKASSVQKNKNSFTVCTYLVHAQMQHINKFKKCSGDCRTTADVIKYRIDAPCKKVSFKNNLSVLVVHAFLLNTKQFFVPGNN